MSKIIFRRIGGRIVPVKISSVKSNAAMGWHKMRNMIAKVEGKVVGSLSFGPKMYKPKTFKIGEVSVDKAFQKKGIAGQLYKRLHEFAKKAGATKIESTQIISPAALKLRNKFDSSFYSLGKGNRKRKISYEQAQKILRTKSVSNLRAITKVKK